MKNKIVFVFFLLLKTDEFYSNPRYGLLFILVFTSSPTQLKSNFIHLISLAWRIYFINFFKRSVTPYPFAHTPKTKHKQMSDWNSAIRELFNNEVYSINFWTQGN